MKCFAKTFQSFSSKPFRFSVPVPGRSADPALEFQQSVKPGQRQPKKGHGLAFIAVELFQSRNDELSRKLLQLFVMASEFCALVRPSGSPIHSFLPVTAKQFAFNLVVRQGGTIAFAMNFPRD